MKHHLFTLLTVLTLYNFISTKSIAQDTHFSQFSETPLLRNPSLAGIFNGDLRIQGVNRTQWGSVTVPFQTTSLNGEYKLPIGLADDYITFAGQILYDKAGTVALKTTELMPAVNYHKSLSANRNMYLSLGFMGGLIQRKLDRSKVTTNNQYDGVTGGSNSGSDGETFSGNGYSYLDGSVGMSFNAEVGENPDNNMYVGLAYHHFNKASKISFFGNEQVAMLPKWVASAGLRTGINDYTYITFYADYSSQGTSTEWLGGILYSYKLDMDADNPQYTITGGAYVRWNDAVIPVAKLEYKPFTVAVSYDINTSKLTTASNGRGGFEISLVYQRTFNRYMRSAGNATRCPRF
jgi:type IX secretion system PorP/SprF family membrane protein